MKKLLAIPVIVLTFVLVFALGGCGKPANMSLEVYSRGQSVVKTTEDYINGKRSFSQAQSKIENDYNAIKSAKSGHEDSNVSTYALLIKDDFFMYEINHDSKAFEQKLKDHLKSLKKSLR